MAKANEYIIVLFVEGDTDYEFYNKLIQFYRANSKNSIRTVKIYNLKGIGKFERKVVAKIKYDILPKYDSDRIIVFCCYDTDVFELGRKPPTNWKYVKKQLANIGITDFNEIKAVKMIEDWFLIDLSGLCNFLKIKSQKSVKGKDGFDKIKKLFKKGNKIYQKGNNSHKFVQTLNISLIRTSLKNKLKKLEEKLKVRL